MADATYGPKVYKKSGGDEQVIASGGEQTVESGGHIAMSTGSLRTEPFEVPSSSGATLGNCGISILSTGTKAYMLEQPTSGALKTILSNNSTTVSVYASTDLTIVFSNTTGCVAVFSGSSMALQLLGVSSSEWRIVNNYNTVTFATAAAT